MTEAAARTAAQCGPRLDDSSQPGAARNRRRDIRGLIKLVADAGRWWLRPAREVAATSGLSRVVQHKVGHANTAMTIW